MAIELKWFGHGTWLLTVGEKQILLDPFFEDNPATQTKADDVSADMILISHGHFDHIADAASIAKRTGAQVVANYEIVTWLGQQHQVENGIGMNIGGQYKSDIATIKMTHAIHSSQLPDGSYGGNPGGFLVTLDGATIYFACDTALFSDMQLIGNHGIDVAVLPMGDLFTMGPEDSIEAIKLLNPKQVLPAHYNTWPPIEQDAEAWADMVRQQTDAEPVVLTPDQSFAIQTQAAI